MQTELITEVILLIRYFTKVLFLVSFKFRICIFEERFETEEYFAEIKIFFSMHAFIVTEPSFNKRGCRQSALMNATGASFHSSLKRSIISSEGQRSFQL